MRSTLKRRLLKSRIVIWGFLRMNEITLELEYSKKVLDVRLDANNYHDKKLLSKIRIRMVANV